MQLSLTLDRAPILPRIRAELVALYGPQRDAERHDPTTQFVRAMLGACTRDRISSAAFLRLCHAFPSWDDLPDADPARIERLIHDVKYAPDKAIRLVASAQIIRSRRGQIDLAFLADWPVDAAMAFLRPLPGIGPKVAAAILNFSALRKRVLVVDRHVLRLSKRLGLLPPKADFERGFRGLTRLIPDDWNSEILYELHWLMKTHGQEVCRHGQPACAACPLLELCAHGTATRRRVSTQEARAPIARPLTSAWR